MTPAVTFTLAELEAVIERGLETFVEVGNALMQIRDSRLYRGTHDTFEGYCKEPWGWSRAHAYRQIAAAEVAQNLSPIGDIPANEAQARELADLTPEQQVEVANRIDFREATACEVRSVVDEVKSGRMAVHFSSESDSPTEAYGGAPKTKAHPN